VLRGTRWTSVTAIAVLVGLGHSFLAMSGWESLAQVYREIEHPKPQNLRRAGIVIFAYSVVFTASVSFLAVALIPTADRPHFYDNLISGLAMHLWGPLSLRLAFQAFVVLVGFLILAGAVNTALVGSNAVVNRISEDGVLPDWFRKPHRKYGTSYRVLNVIAALQLLTVALSRGDLYLLGEAYAFGVVWSFALKSLAVLVLRYRAPGPREWRVPFNLRIGRTEFPLGLGLITAVLFAIAVVNLFTKQMATLSGVSFTILLYGVFVVSERRNAKRHSEAGALDQFQLLPAADLALAEVDARPSNVLVPVRDYNSLAHLDWALDHAGTGGRDVVAMTVRLLQGPDAGFRDFDQKEVFTDYEQRLFTRVVAVAERHGRPVKLLVVPSSQVSDAVAQTAVRLASSEIVLGQSSAVSAASQAIGLGDAWERLERGERRQTRLVVLDRDGAVHPFVLGPHAPTLTRDDLDLIHQIWLDAVAEAGIGVHHRDVVRAALERLRRDLGTSARSQAIALIRRRSEEPAEGSGSRDADV
jgi:hypothetical protein